MEISRGLYLVFACATASLPFGCSYKSLTTAETDVVLTLQDEGRDYAKLKTYALSPDVVDLCQLASEDELGGDVAGAGGSGGARAVDLENCFSVDHSFDATIIDTIASNFDELGYRRITDLTTEAPDIVVVSAIVARDNWFVGSAWCDPFYYYGCWYPNYSYAYNLPTGTVLVQAVDVAESQDGEWSHVWTAAVQGLYAESFELTGAQRLERALDQAFDQSAYLQTGGDQ